MAYQTEFRPDRAEECRLEAERRAGTSELGYLYRLDRQSYASSDEYGDYYSSRSVVELTAYRIHKLTPCGWTLDIYTGARRRFVSRETYKRFALPTVDEAIESFVARQNRRIAIMQARITESERAIEMVRPTIRSLAA